MSKRESSSLILQNLKKRDLPQRGEPVVPLQEAERQMSAGAGLAIARDSTPASYQDSVHDSTTDRQQTGTRLRPRERAARSALIVRLDPRLHRRLDEVARYNRLTMNDIATEAIELHLGNFPHPPDSRSNDA